MAFSSCLQGYLDEARCSAQELADAAQVSASSVSRYLSGERTPNPRGNVIPKLAVAIAARTSLEAKQVEADLIAAATAGEADYAAFSKNLGRIMETFGIANNRLARFLDYDPSYISRILAGQRRPADLASFIDGVAAYIARNNFDESGKAKAADLVGMPVEKISHPEDLAFAIREFLGSNVDSPTRIDAVGAFLAKLDEFELNDFLRDIKFDEIKVPTAPFQLPTTKTYSGIEQMKQAELDFLKAAVLSRSTEDVILYSDMPLEEMAADEEFPKKVMAGMAMLIRKGVRLLNIHDVHRPFNELIMGLEGWIPVYMTGQIEPYYLPQPTNSAFLHFLRSAGTVAVSGEAIVGNQEGGRYVVTKNPGDVAYLRQRATELLGRAKPLIRIFQSGEEKGLERALKQLDSKTNDAPVEVGRETFKNMRITVSAGSYALIEKQNDPRISFLIEYPALVDALVRYESMLF